jgi:transposase-like protein
MNGVDYKSYFMQPVETAQRRYEALRCVFVEEQTMKQVGQRFGLSYGTIRNWVSEFSRAQEAGQSPPFSLRHRADGPWPIRSQPTSIRQSKSPMLRR